MRRGGFSNSMQTGQAIWSSSSFCAITLCLSAFTRSSFSCIIVSVCFFSFLAFSFTRDSSSSSRIFILFSIFATSLSVVLLFLCASFLSWPFPSQETLVLPPEFLFFFLSLQHLFQLYYCFCVLLFFLGLFLHKRL